METEPLLGDLAIGGISAIVRVRVLARVPAGESEGQPTQLGLQSRNQMLRPGKPAGKDLVEFLVGLPLMAAPRTGAPRFQGLFVHDDPQIGQHLLLCWRHRQPPGSDAYLSRLKIHLDLTRAQVRSAVGCGGILEIDGKSVDWSGAASPEMSGGWVLRTP